MLRVILDSDQRAAVETLRRDPTLAPAERDRVEMLLLSAAGWTVPQIADHFACCHATVRRLLHRFATEGTAALRRHHPGPAPNLARRHQILQALDRLLAQERTWTATQLASALRDEAMHLSARQLRRYLRQVARWRRVARSLHHKQDPQAGPRAGRPGQGGGGRAQKGAQVGELTLAYLDECGVAPSQPVNYSWTPVGTRKWLPYENPQRRRVNAIGILIPDGPEPMLIWDKVPRSLTSQDVLTVLQDVPKQNGRVVVVMDHGSIHSSHVIKEALPGLKAEGVEFYYLPPYRPELHRIEPIFGGIKHHDLPERAYLTVPDLMDAIDDAFTNTEDRLLAKHQRAHQLRPAA